MSRIRVIICLMVLAVVASTGRADVVTDWNNITLDAIKTANLPATQSSRVLAMVQIAVFDAVNGIDRKYEPFYVRTRTNPASASPEAAAIAAAYTVLVNLLPSQQREFYKLRLASLADIPDSRGKQNGVSWGVYAGSVVAYTRRGDGSNWPGVFKPVEEPGLWRPTPPKFAKALDPQWVHVQPFVIKDLDEFVPPPSPELSSTEYADVVNEVKDIGAKDSATRTADQTEIAYFWDDGANTISPPGRWNKIAQVISQQMGTNLDDNARLFALLNIAMADGTISCWQCKFHYDLWRPITAIREADTAGNPLIVEDNTWTPLLATPPFPEYTAGHATLAGAGAEVLKLFYGTDDIPFDLYSEVIDATRSFSSLSQAADEDCESRIYGGIHYQFSVQTGEDVGRKVADYVFANVLTPL